jgi:acyl-CoA oxidase
MTSSSADAATRRLVAEAAREIVAATSDPKADMAAERARASFPSAELAALVGGGAARVAARARLANLLAAQPWGDKAGRYFLSREEEYVGALRAYVGIFDLLRAGTISFEDAIDARALLFLPAGLELHIGMFIPSLQSQGTPEQQARWLPLANSLRVIGTYAQTEMGHGTFIRGLETVAVYDPRAREFVVHSPTLTSTKWWPGGLGKTATHCILMARLCAGGADRGPHALVVQLRDLESHRPLPGVEIGDIGPKMGYNGVDNGLLRFDHVRVPRDALLARYARVEEDGTYVPAPPSNSKAAYATMVYVRATIVADAGAVLGRAATIALRYTAVRRQTAHAPGARELQVLDYDNVSQTLLSLAARAYALAFIGRDMMRRYDAFDGERAGGDFSALPELHALSSGLKALCTDAAAAGIEAARRCCGGHGYSLLSGLPTLFASYVQNCTWEGDNSVMYLQTARFCVKALAAAGGGARPRAAAPGRPGSAAYLDAARAEAAARAAVVAPADWGRPEHALAALRHVAAREALLAAEVVMAAGGGRLVFEGEPWFSSTVALIACATAHCELAAHQTFHEAVEAAAASGEASPPTAAALRRLVALHGVCALERAAGELLEGGHVTGEQAAWLRAEKRALVRALRPDAVALADGFGCTDYQLNSALGRADGDVYNALLEMARASPLNASEEGPAWEGVLKPLLAPSARAARARL